MKNKKADPSLRVSNVIDNRSLICLVDKALLPLDVKVLETLNVKNWKNEVLRAPIDTLAAKDEYSHSKEINYHCLLLQLEIFQQLNRFLLQFLNPLKIGNIFE